MNKDTKYKKIRRSPKIEEIMNKKPHFIIRWGTLLICIIFVILGFIAFYWGGI